MRLQDLTSAIVEAASNWSKHKDARAGAALAYYSVFSLGPIIVIVTAVAGLVFGADLVRGELGANLKSLVGPTGGAMVEALLAGASQPRQGGVALLIGAATLVFAAVGIVVQLKDALNGVWEVDPARSSGIAGFIRTYVVSMAGVLSLGFMLIVSLVVTTVLSALGKHFAAGSEAMLQFVGSLASVAILASLFAMMFKWLPDAEIAWHDVLLGATLTALLFELGKFLISYYIGKQGLDSAFGATASLVVVLIWVYYTAQIVLMGAEFTRVFAERHGSKRPPTVPRP